MIHLAVEQLRVADGTDIDLAPDPVSAFAGDALLFQSIGELQPIDIDDEGFLLCLLRIERVEE
jgi:hypothetical protein